LRWIALAALAAAVSEPPKLGDCGGDRVGLGECDPGRPGYLRRHAHGEA
jgi:hypothetical protein